MRVRSVEIDAFRSLTSFTVGIDERINVVFGPNGAGKTNFVEAIYFALTGRSFRTGDRRDLIPFGGTHARAEVEIEAEDGSINTFAAAVSRAEGRRYTLDGEPIEARSSLSYRPPVLVFSPDRLILVKGPPGERRAHIDAFAAALRPSQGELRRRFGQGLAQRNATLARVSQGRAASSELDSWDRTLAMAAVPLIEARSEALEQVKPHYAVIAAELGLPGEGTLEYRARFSGSVDEMTELLCERRAADLEQSRTTVGPHLDDIVVEQDGRSMRRFGSQGQQRLSLLALLLAEREALMASWAPPLLLLDDVLSELDPQMRDRLQGRLGAGGQSVITGADASFLPASGDANVLAIADLAAEPVIEGKGSDG